MEIDELLRAAMQGGATDVHLVVVAPSMLHLNHELVRTSGESMTHLLRSRKHLNLSHRRASRRLSKRTRTRFCLDHLWDRQVQGECFPAEGSIALAIRCLRVKVPSMEELGIPDIYKTLIMKRKGSILVTGPTSSGRSTTGAAMIDYLDGKATRKVVTVEEPIESLYCNRKCLIIQRELGEDSTSFASAMRPASRRNSDVILVGER